MSGYSPPPPRAATDTAMRTYGARMRRFRIGQAVSTNQTATAHLILIGDSLTMGSVATAKTYTWAETMRRWLNAVARVGRTLSDGWVPCGTVTPFTPRFATTAGAPVNNTVGLGQWGVNLLAGDSIAMTSTCRRILVNYRRRNDTGAAQLRVLDGASTLATLPTHDATAGTGTCSNLYDSGDLGALASRTITLSGIGGSTEATPIGVYFFGDDNTSELCVWNGGISGFDTAEYLALGPTATDIATGIGLKTVDANVNFIVELGINDAFAFGLTVAAAAAFGDRLGQLVDQLRSQAVNAFFTYRPADVLLVAPHCPLTIDTAGFELYRAAVYRVADQKGCAVLDWSSLMGKAQDGLSPDGIHFNNAGHQLVGFTTAQMLLGATGT